MAGATRRRRHDHGPRPGPSVRPPRDPRRASSYGPVFATKRAPHSPLRDCRRDRGRGAGRDLAHRHGPRLDRHPGQDRSRRGRHHDRRDRRVGPRLPRPRPLALRPARQGGPGHLRLRRRAGAGRARPGPGGQGRSSSSSTSTARQRTVTVEERQVGRTRFDRLEIDAATVASQPALVETLVARADPDLVLDVRLVGRPSRRPRPRHRRDRGRDRAVVPQGPRPRRLGPRADRGSAAVARTRSSGRSSATSRPGSRELEAAGSTAEAAEQRDALRLGRLLLAGHEVSL